MRLHFAWPRRWICAPRRTMPPPAGKKAGSYPLAVYAPWRTRSTCPNPGRMFPHLTCRWEREYEVSVRALTLREEVADGRPLVHRTRTARRIEGGWPGWTVSSIFDGHTCPVYENHTTRLDRSRDRKLTH